MNPNIKFIKPRAAVGKLRRMPMVGALTILICGILFFDRVDAPTAVVWGGFILCGAMSAAIRKHRAGLVYTLFAIFFFGGGIRSLRNSECTIPCNRTIFAELAVEEPPARRERSLSAPARILSYECDGIRGAADCRVMLFADTSLRINIGDRIRCIARIRPFRADESSYRQLMLRRGFAGTLFISPADVVSTSPDSRKTLHAIAVRRLAMLDLPRDATAVVGAAGAGDRSGLSPELRRAYSRSGASHVLAVSGLHVGIVFMLMNILFGWLPALRYGHILRCAAVTIPVWLYASASGMSPSVVRAAAMFSMLQIAIASSAVRVAPNILAAAAFVMLTFDPDALFDISFQLSFTAVAAIIAVGKPLFRILHSRNIILRALWDTTVIGTVATVATAPLVSRTFGIVPLAGILINPIVILCAYIIVAVSAVWIIAPLPLLAPFAETVLRITAELQNTAVAALSSQPRAAVDYTLSERATAAAYLLFIAIISLCACIERKKSVHLPE